MRALGVSPVTVGGVAMLVASCGLFDSPTPASVEITASADTIMFGSLVPSGLGLIGRDSVSLTAIVRDADGKEFSGDSVEWTSSADVISVRPTGRRSAKASWFSLGGTQPITIEARLRGALGRKDLIACGVIQVAAKNSA